MTTLIVVALVIAYLGLGLLAAWLQPDVVDDDPMLAGLTLLVWPLLVVASVASVVFCGLGWLVLKVLR